MWVAVEDGFLVAGQEFHLHSPSVDVCRPIDYLVEAEFLGREVAMT